MAPKRAAAPSPKKRGRPSKAQKVEEAPVVDELYNAAADLLNKLSPGLTKGCLAMLQESLPHIVGTKKAERHKFQVTMTDKLSELCTKMRAEQEQAITDARAELEALATEKAGSDEKLQAASAEEQARRAEKEAAQSGVASGIGAAATADAAVKEARRVVQVTQESVDVKAKAKTEFDTQVSEVFPPLKDGAFPGKEWRQRQRSITLLMGLVWQTEAPESLKVAVPIALKDVPANRGAMATKAVDEVERVLKVHSETLEAAVAAAKAEVTERLEDAEKAEVLAKEALAARDAAQDACIAKENEWLEAEEACATLKRNVADYPEKKAGIEQSIEDAQQRADELKGAFERFDLLDNAPPAPPTPEPAAAAEPTTSAEPPLPPPDTEAAEAAQ